MARSVGDESFMPESLLKLKSPEFVAQGPFRGMRYVSSSFCSEILPKLVGTYENETIEAIECICDAGCDLIVDIGAAEGYYAVGMALSNPPAVVIGFERNASARYYLHRLARLNGVAERVRVRGTCDLESLANVMDGSRRPALICDCEGAEDFLLVPDRIEPLKRAFVLVETHDGLTTDAGVLEGISGRLRERFDATHFVEVISSRPRSQDDLPPEHQFSTEEAELAMDEGRPYAQWLFMKPRIQDRS